MKIVIIGGTGLIGRKLATKLQSAGHEVVAASPSTGVNSLTGEGLKEALTGANVVVDVTNSPSFEDNAVLDFFRRSTGNLLSAAKAAGVSHYVALSVVGCDRIRDSGYLQAKLVQEGMIEAGGAPYTVLRATQFFEFLKAIADGAMEGNVVHMSPGKFQPVAADDVAATWPRSRLPIPRTGSSSWRALKPPAWPSSFSRSCRPSVTHGRSFPIPMRNISARPSTRTVSLPRANSLLDRHASPIGGAPNDNPPHRKEIAVKKIALLLLGGATLLSANVAAEETPARAAKISKIFDRELPNVPGKSMRAVLVEYGPGAASPSHRHPPSAFIYATVLEGEIRSKVNDDPEHVYKAGETWTEVPGDHHQVSANASATKPARLLAIFVVDTTEQEILIPDK